MNAAAYRRAHRLLEARPGTVMAARALGALRSLLILAILGWAGLLLSLLLSRGESVIPPNEISKLPHWLSGQAPVSARDYVRLTDTGLFPIVANNVLTDTEQPTPWPHRAFGRAVLATMSAIPTLRNDYGALTTLLAMGLALLLALSAVDRWRTTILAEATSRASAALRRQIHRQMYRLGQSSLPTEGTGPVVNLFTREVNDVRDGLFAELERAPRVYVRAVGLVLIALGISWSLTIFLATLTGLVWLAARALDRRARLAAEAATRDGATQLYLLQEDLGLLRTVRVYGMEPIDNRRFDEHLERYRASDARRLRTEGSISPTTGLLVGAAAVLAVGWIGYDILLGGLSPAAAVVLVAALLGLRRPILDYPAMRRASRQAVRSANGIFEFLERKPELHQTGGAKFLPPMREQIRIEDVTLQSPSGRTLLDGVTAEIPARTRTAIMSLEEDAKHALVCLIPRLIDPKRGRVLIDGHDLRDVTLESIRAQVATVLQADLVFSDSVAANIGLGDPSYDLPRITEAAKIAHAHHFIQDLPHGYDTIIGPLGHYLRADEQYRIALARAFLHDPSIVIIEEPNIALDEATKHLIDDTIARLAPNRTLIFLPHRLSTIRSCDRIIVLHEGRVEAFGAPRELQGTNKLYRHLQYVEFNQFATGEIEAGQMNA
jgi:ABC-type multidrug transport system fused ATPase/permease subunit